MPLNRREALAVVAGGIAYVASDGQPSKFRLGDVAVCSRLLANGIRHKSNRFFASLKNGRSVEITESEYNWIWEHWDERHQPS